MSPRIERDDPDDAPAPVPDDLDDEDDIFDPMLLDPAAWRDDDDVPVPDDPLSLDADLPDVATAHDETDDEPAEVAVSPPLDDLDDLDATDQVDPVVLPWNPRVEVVAAGETRTVDAVVQPGLARSVWEAPGTPAGASDVSVVLRIEGLAVPAELRRAVADRERITLGRDVLAGRFLLRL